MLLPNADRAEIDPEKLRGYLLSNAHPVGRFKARFFTALGFSAERWQAREEALRLQHLPEDAHAGKNTTQGQTYTIRYSERTIRPSRRCRKRLVCAGGREHPAIRHRVPRETEVTINILDVVVLNRDIPTHGLKRGDLGAVVDMYAPDAMEVEFVTASGRTQALITLRRDDVREVGDDDLVAVRPAESAAAGRDG